MYSMFDPKVASRWMPVDVYVGGIEHAILHLLYARFITKFLHDKGLVSCSEPFTHLLTQGMVHGKTYKHPVSGKFLQPHEIEEQPNDTFIEKSTGTPLLICFEKMSKSKYNGVDPEVYYSYLSCMS
jgi:leucyl-tRNA synthetase